MQVWVQQISSNLTTFSFPTKEDELYWGSISDRFDQFSPISTEWRELLLRREEPKRTPDYTDISESGVIAVNEDVKRLLEGSCCPENGVYLPQDFRVACMYGIPLHWKNHGAGETHFFETRYNKGVQILLEDVLGKYNDGAYCEMGEDPLEDLHDISKDIWVYVSEFTWQLTYRGDAFHPKSKWGCCNSTLIPNFKERIGKPKGECEKKGKHKVELPSGKFFKERGSPTTPQDCKIKINRQIDQVLSLKKISPPTLNT